MRNGRMILTHHLDASHTNLEFIKLYCGLFQFSPGILSGRERLCVSERARTHFTKHVLATQSTYETAERQ